MFTLWQYQTLLWGDGRSPALSMMSNPSLPDMLNTSRYWDGYAFGTIFNYPLTLIGEGARLRGLLGGPR